MKLAQATPAQREAITTDRPDVLLAAGPGSGKTATIVARVNYLVARGTPPDEIAFLTYTNAAAAEFAKRLSGPTPAEVLAHALNKANPGADSLGFTDAKTALGFAGTLHSFALRMLREHGEALGYGDRIAIVSPQSSEDLLASKAKTLGCKSSMKALLALKAAGAPTEDRLTLEELVVKSFLDDLQEAGVVDYDVLLQAFRRALLHDLSHEEDVGLAFRDAIARRFRHLFVDEVQDAAPIDWDIFHALPIESKFYAGDPDQAIFGFRGGRVREMVEHSAAVGTTTIRLEDNFRCLPEICEAANALIARNRTRIEKRTVSTRVVGGQVFVAPPFANAGEEIGGVARMLGPWLRTENAVSGVVPSHFEPGAYEKLAAIATPGPGPYGEPAKPSIAILARTNAIADGFRKGLPPLGINVAEVQRADLPRDWALARSFVELLVNPDNDALAFFYLIARYEKEGLPPAAARKAAHTQRREATQHGKSLNRAAIGLRNNRGIGAVSSPRFAMEALAEIGASREALAIAAEKFRELPPGATLAEFALALGEVREFAKEEEGDGVRVLTIHGAKGREFDVVFLVGAEDGTIPGRAAKQGDEAVEEERRLFYVAITRARREVYITSAASRVTPWNQVTAEVPSRFVEELGGAR